MELIILSVLLAGSLAAPASQSLTFNDDGSYRFYYETGKEGGSHSREEFRDPDGVVVGKFSYEDANGDMRQVNYRADDSGYTAEGDVGVADAPKGQFPVVVPEEELQTSPPDVPQEESLPSEEAQPADDQTSDSQPADTPEAVEEAIPEDQVDHDKDAMNDLALEESTADDPPEAFPEGFFLQKFQGLRRLPEPVPEEKVASTEPPAAEDSPKKDVSIEQPKVPKVQAGNAPGMTSHLMPFPHFAPQQWGASMLHQPVYVFSYQQPDSYGYHYYF